MTLDIPITFGVWAAVMSFAGIVGSTIGATISGWRRHVDTLWSKYEAWQIEQDHETALAMEEVRTDLVALYRKIHYRHNIHCPRCGRFSRQAEGWPSGVADCGLHGLGIRTSPETGAIPVIILSVEQ